MTDAPRSIPRTPPLAFPQFTFLFGTPHPKQDALGVLITESDPHMMPMSLTTPLVEGALAMFCPEMFEDKDLDVALSIPIPCDPQNRSVIQWATTNFRRIFENCFGLDALANLCVTRCKDMETVSDRFLIVDVELLSELRPFLLDPSLGLCIVMPSTPEVRTPINIPVIRLEGDEPQEWMLQIEKQFPGKKSA